MEKWQQLWSLVPTPASELEALRGVLEQAPDASEAFRLSVERLPVSVRWVAEDILSKRPAVIAVLMELVDLVLARRATNENLNDVGEAILRYEWLTRSNEPAGSSRCYCGSGKKYKQCHGAAGDEHRRAGAIRRRSKR